MVTIRLSRGGAKKRPFYHIIVADGRSKRDGRHLERVGFYNPLATGQEEPFRIDRERYDYWLSVGARPSERVTQLVKANTAAA
ncbi:MAG: 30S ribosomal protein S16 [Gammaproteobacteria bacterium]|nr:30S ribosomal protein S16 [Gammaproteobacteria bacterium]MCP5202054.1 30S ribosomal protein S16 [Gammaproteobacteria bacterium]